MKHAARLLLYLIAVAVTAYLGSLATRSGSDGWYAEADKPWFTPPDWVFGPVWTVLYVAMAVAVWLAWRAGGPTLIWWVQLAINLAWTPVFFGLEWLWAGLVVIVALIGAIVATILAFRPWSRAAAMLMAPYLAWVLYATALNAGVAALNT
jgi:tryptophan-rich sensory protein